MKKGKQKRRASGSEVINIAIVKTWIILFESTCCAKIKSKAGNPPISTSHCCQSGLQSKPSQKTLQELQACYFMVGLCF